MSLKITSATKGAGACQHYTVTIDEDSVTRTVRLSVAELQDWLDTVVGEHPPGVLLALAWASYKRKKGATLASLLNVEIA